MGLEEASEWGIDATLDSIALYYRGREDFEPSGVPRGDDTERAGRSIRAYTCKIAQRVSESGAVDWRDYRKRFLCTKGTQLFQANLFPLGKPTRASWPKHYESLFGFGEQDRSGYEAYVKNWRFGRITKLWRESEAQAVVCFGKEGWTHCKEIFGVTEDGIEIEANKVYSFPHARMILAPFFSRHMTNRRAELIGDCLVSWGVRIDRRAELSIPS